MKRLLSATLALSLLGGTAAMAAPPSGYVTEVMHRDYDRYDRRDRDDRRDWRRDRWDRERHDRDFYRYRDFRGGYYRDRPGFRHYGWRRGDHFDHRHYRGRYVVVHDWHHHHHLYAPPRGYHWVRHDGDFLLVAAATGLIASVILNGY